MGVDRLLAALETLGRVGGEKTPAQVLVTVMDENLSQECMSIAFELRRAGIRTEIHVGTGRLGKQLKRADRLGIPFTVLLGTNEAERGVVTVKQMAVAREKGAAMEGKDEWKAARFGQKTVRRSEVAETLRRMLDGAL